MPAMIVHDRIGRRVLAEEPLLDDLDREAFLLGTQGPDILYFFRAYPWLPGPKGLDLGNALHEACPATLMDALCGAVEHVAAEHRHIAESYALGFLCHYAADRTIHPFVMAVQECMMREDPQYASDRNPYHYRIESALDTLVYTDETGKSVRRFSLCSLIPKREPLRDAVIGEVVAFLVRRVLHKEADEALLSKLRADMRHSMWWMTDRTGLKRTAFRVMETLFRKDPWYSSLIRTPRVAWYDFANKRRETWGDGETADIWELCDRTVKLTAELVARWKRGDNGTSLTEGIDFTGMPYQS